MIPKRTVAFITLSLVGLMISACAIQRAQEASDAQAKMIGLSKEQVLTCMGTPTKTAAAGNTGVWSYNSGNSRTDTFGAADAWGGGGWASAFGSSTTTSRYCKVDVVINADHVSRVNYSGPTGGLLTKGEQCAFAVENRLH